MSNMAASAQRILVVEDDVSIRRMIEVIASRHGLLVDSANDGAQAIAMLSARKYAAVVLDIMLPVQNGLEVLTYLTANQLPLVARTVAITASLRLIDEVTSTGVQCVLAKPFDVQTLIDQLLLCCSAALQLEEGTP